DRQIFCEIENFSDQVHEFPFEISLDGAVLKSETIRLHSKQRERAVTDVPAGSYGIIRAAIRAEDSLEIDNEACAILEQHGIRVLLGTAGNTFLQKALEANPRIALTVLDPEACTTEELDKGYDIIVLDGFEPPRLPPANYLLIRSGPGRSIGRGSLRGEPREPVFTRPDHPVLAFLDPGDFTIDRAAGPDLSPADTVLIEGNGLPLLAANEIGVHRTVKLRFDIRDSGLALTYAFPVLVSNILSWLDSGNAGAGNQAAAGSAIRLRLPGYDPSKDLVVETPDGGTYSTKADKGVVTIAETERAGVYNVRQDRTVERFVVNLSSKAESDIKPADTLSDNNPRTTDRAATAGAGRGIWRWLLLASLILLVLEWRRYQGTAL
ncbi:MAG: hypothetical protein JW793_13030, partial [Acidobacteria bacterium]|nr:hypothetical protein [Acidobacteriota bacterium]